MVINVMIENRAFYKHKKRLEFLLISILYLMTYNYPFPDTFVIAPLPVNVAE